MLGNTTAVPVPPHSAVLTKKSRGFLKLMEEETLSDIPVFNLESGDRQISLTTQSLVFDLVNNISNSNKLTFGVTNMNINSDIFLINADFLSKIYPGFMTAYPRDAPIAVNALINNITYSTLDFTGFLNMTVTVTDTALVPNTLLKFITNANFTTAINLSPLLNFNVSSIVADHSTIVSAPYGFVDASTLGRWVDDSFANYNTANWALFKNGLNFTSIVGAINTTASSVNGQTIFYAGN